MHYARSVNKLFCLPCCFFAVYKPQSKAKVFNEQGFSDWRKINDAEKGVKAHFQSISHKEAFIKCTKFEKECKRGISEVLALSNTRRQRQADVNKKNLEATVETIRLCGKQMLPLRGHRETVDDADDDRNRGNVLVILDTLAIYSKEVQEIREMVRKKQMSKKRAQGAMHSKDFQNQVLEIFGDCILKDIVSDVKDVGCFVLIADETMLHSKQYLSVNIQYVNQVSKQAHEECS